MQLRVKICFMTRNISNNHFIVCGGQVTKVNVSDEFIETLKTVVEKYIRKFK